MAQGAGTVHVVGAGLAGLSAAVRLTEQGVPVRLWEAAPFAGGRCRTFHDPRLDCAIDNGNHLLLSGNPAAMAYLDTVGGRGAVETAPEAAFPFADLGTGERWTVRIGDGRLPVWLFDRDRRVAGTGLADYLGALRLAMAGRDATVADVVRDRGPIWTRFWEPMTLAVLNTTPEIGAARPLWRVLSETFLAGGRHCRPVFAPRGLGTALVDPALDWLARHGVRPTCRAQLRGIDRTADRATRLAFADRDPVPLDPGDGVVLALPPSRLRPLLPLDPPDDSCGILNAHFRVAPGVTDGLPPLLGTIGSTTHWIFVKGDVISLTVSAADRLGLMTADPEDLIPRLWAETVAAHRLGDRSFLAARINKERRATFDQSPNGITKRPESATFLDNLWLAGDSTNTGLPATIEGAIRSGATAAGLAAARGRAWQTSREPSRTTAERSTA